MTTKERILSEALTLFSEKGYSDVYVGDIAAAVGIRAPSLYKHFKSKRDIFDAILQQMDESYQTQAAMLNINGSDPMADVGAFAAMSEDTLVQGVIGLFSYFLHDKTMAKFRKMLTIEQFHDKALAQLYTEQYVDAPLHYQSQLLGLLFPVENTDIIVLQFYAPIHLLLTLCDRHPEREKEALEKLEQHVRQFNRLYQKEDK